MISYDYGILGEKAPNWNVSQWFNLPQGKETLEISDFEGQIVYLYCFQSWCPGCHSHGIPTLKMVQEEFKDASDLAFIAVQTVFEGFNVNTLEAAKKTAERHKLTLPIGHDAPNGERSNIMHAYKTGGTPWTVVIDKNRRIQFEGFHAQPGELSRLISALREGQ